MISRLKQFGLFPGLFGGISEALSALQDFCMNMVLNYNGRKNDFE